MDRSRRRARSPRPARPPAGGPRIARAALRGAGTRAARAARVTATLRRVAPAAHVELEHGNAFELLIATILSAQCTDARVNQVTPALFATYPDAAAMAGAPPDDLERRIRSTGFYRAKARSILGCCRALVERHDGEVPRRMEELVRLPGVGRKTANVILGAAFGRPEGIVVDTHMGRVARRLDLTRADDPVRIERDLMRIVPRRDWIFFSTAMVLHGRYVCLARRPRCVDCPLSADCPSREVGSPDPPRPRRGRRRG